jgi:DNA-binding FadR family transcriptional regulator
MFKSKVVCLRFACGMDHKEKLSDKVGNLIRNDIVQQKFKQGEKIPAEPELMQRYGVGRSTIREAIKSLSIAGMLKVQQGFGTIVNAHLSDLTIDQCLKQADFEEVNAVRSLLESEIVKLATRNHSLLHLQEMEQCLRKRKEAILQDLRQDCVDADIDFHMAIAYASGNKVLVDLYHSFISIIQDFFSKREKHGVRYFAMSHHLHEQLFCAIKCRKEKQAQQALQEILTNNY